MAIEKIDIDKFLRLSVVHPVLDVRSPSEYGHAHIPGANSFPLFSDEERKVVGTAYKQQDRQTAIKIGMDYFGCRMRKMVEEAETLVAENRNSQSANGSVVLVHCWRGGMRSGAVAWLLDLYGFQVYTLNGGYKSFRRYVLDTFSESFQFIVLSGLTGSGKTMILQDLSKKGEQVIDLEKLASHRGSAFGAIGLPPQPSQEMFETLLALELRCLAFTQAPAEKSGKSSEPLSPEYKTSKPIWLEDESQRIGSVIIPAGIWKLMRNSPGYFLDIPFEARLNHIINEYGGLEEEQVTDAILRIQKRLGGLETNMAIACLREKKIKESFTILVNYYDKLYSKGARDSGEGLFKKIILADVNESNADSLLAIHRKILTQNQTNHLTT